MDLLPSRFMIGVNASNVYTDGRAKGNRHRPVRHRRGPHRRSDRLDPQVY
jgi:hypothetical protein